MVEEEIKAKLMMTDNKECLTLKLYIPKNIRELFLIETGKQKFSMFELIEVV